MMGLMAELCDAYANVALLIQAGLITSKDYTFTILEPVSFTATLAKVLESCDANSNH